MDGPSAFALALLILSFGYVSNQIVANDAGQVTVNSGMSDIDGNITACTNGRGAAGGCVMRMRCNFRTSNIDLMGYGPRGYRNPCPGEGLNQEVCCPTGYILPVTNVTMELTELKDLMELITKGKSSDDNDDKFDFDDDDDDDSKIKNRTSIIENIN